MFLKGHDLPSEEDRDIAYFSVSGASSHRMVSSNLHRIQVSFSVHLVGTAFVLALLSVPGRAKEKEVKLGGRDD